MIVIITTIIATSPMTLSHYDYQYQHEMQNLASFHHTMARGVLSFEFLVCRGCHRGCRPAGTHKARTRSNLVINVGLKSSAEKPPLTTRVISGTCVIMASAVGDMHNSINRTHATREVKVLTLLDTAVRMSLLGAGTARHGRKETTTTKSLPETTQAIALPRHSNACKHPPSQCHPQQFSKPITAAVAVQESSWLSPSSDTDTDTTKTTPTTMTTTLRRSKTRHTRKCC